MENQKNKRVQINDQNGIFVYSVGFWPGWSEIITLSVFYFYIVVVFGFLLYVMAGFSGAIDMFGKIFEIDWLHTILSFLVAGAFDIALIALLGFLVLWIPYFLIYQLSPKKFWIENNTLFHAAYLFGLIPNKRKIPFEQILNVEANESNGRYAVTVLYERSLPKWLFVILVYWNEKLTQWPLTLINGVPTREEAEMVQTTLLEPMTRSDACRISAESLHQECVTKK